ncbi:hypothetical protein A1O3_03569 [Capronia epimyces CBS 606.96]|uniref:Transcription factor domain-containing protein n=1 Tax=Capronia epimyces CBS 606.96 TaxID=1182542 RepID=W9YBH6_9EURO|nr:uncharacterized protein A1O3_03569 [Capronia epimyces CBS 606.96]EXJ86616.1 hypothetical protein A1O3_03569 [Capronia epimyces CBS 606.96]
MKDRDTTDSKPVYLFVNKTQKSKSLSKSDGAVAKQINRHAQHFRSRKVEAEKISSALSSSSSARRIALDGWLRRGQLQGTPANEASQTSIPDQDGSTAVTTPAIVTGLTGPDTASAASIWPLAATLPSRTRPWRSPGTPASRGVVSSDGAHGTHDQDQNLPPDEDLDLTDDGDVLQLSSIYRANFTGYDCVDPFGITPVQITTQIHSILQHTLQVYTYSGNNYKLAFLPPHVRSTISRFPIGEVVERSVYKEYHLYALMALMAARLKYCFDVSRFGDDAGELRAAASYHLRKELIRASRSGDLDKQTILDILFLVVNEVQYGRYDDARKHLQVVGRLFHLLDHRQHFDRWVSETAAHVDNQLALTTATLPVIKRSFDPGPMLPERMAALRREAQSLRYYGCSRPSSMALGGPKASLGLTDTIADLAQTLDLRMGTGLAHGLKAGAFRGKMGSVVSDLVDCIEIAKVVWLSPFAVCFDAEWLCRKARAVLRALAFMAPENHVSPSDVDIWHEGLRICLMILMTHACTLVGFHTAKAQARRLKMAEEAALAVWCPTIGWTEDCISWDPHRRLPPLEETRAGLTLWEVLTGVWSSDGLPEQEWFIVRAVNLCRYFGYSTYDDLHNHMAQYLYSSSFQEQSLRTVAQRLQDVLAQPSGGHV